MSKIFGIGLSRTGTTSLGKALTILGYRSKHYPRIAQQGNSVVIDQVELEYFEALTDLPVAANYKRLDRQFPGSRFIFTDRDIDTWLASCQRYRRFHQGYNVGPNVRSLRRKMYGVESFDFEIFKQGYIAHQADVEEYFAERPMDLLKMDICGGDGWAKLCRFLDKPIPATPFPHLNVGLVSARTRPGHLGP